MKNDVIDALNNAEREIRDLDAGFGGSVLRVLWLLHQAIAKSIDTTPVSTCPADATASQLAELEQWRKAFAWRQNGIGLWVLRVSNTRSELTHISKDSIGGWIVGGKVIYPTIDEAMRAAEAALGLPKCHTEGEP